MAYLLHIHQLGTLLGKVDITLYTPICLSPDALPLMSYKCSVCRIFYYLYLRIPSTHWLVHASLVHVPHDHQNTFYKSICE